MEREQQYNSLLLKDLSQEIKAKKCLKTFKTVTTLKTHQKNVHLQLKTSNILNRQICDICGVDFASTDTLRKHKKTIHAETKAFECSLCAKTFSRPLTFKSH